MIETRGVRRPGPVVYALVVLLIILAALVWWGGHRLYTWGCWGPETEKYSAEYCDFT